MFALLYRVVTNPIMFVVITTFNRSFFESFFLVHGIIPSTVHSLKSWAHDEHPATGAALVNVSL